MIGKHTPGPWWTDGKYSVDECGIAIIAARTDCGPMPGNPTRGMVAWASEILPENADRCEANARLIGAAPELADLCEMVARLNPAAGEIGAGMLANMVEKARNIMVQIEGRKENK